MAIRIHTKREQNVYLGALKKALEIVTEDCRGCPAAPREDCWRRPMAVDIARCDMLPQADEIETEIKRTLRLKV